MIKVAVIGAGIIGMTTAQHLSRAGCSVSVFEQGSTVGQGASFSSSGVINPMSVKPVFDKLFVKHYLKSLFNLNLSNNYKNTHWTSSFGLNAMITALKTALYTRAYHLTSTVEALNQLAEYSELVLNHDIDTQMIPKDIEQGDGYLELFHNQDEFNRFCEKVQRNNERLLAIDQQLQSIKNNNNNHNNHLNQTWFNDVLSPSHILSIEQLKSIEPALVIPDTVVGAVYQTDCSVMNCALLAKKLKGFIHNNNPIQYYLNHKVLELIKPTKHHKHWVIKTMNHQDYIYYLNNKDSKNLSNINVFESFDVVIVCANQGSQRLLSPYKLDLPIVSLNTYSVTLPMSETINLPHSPVYDVSSGVSIVPLGGRVRITGCLKAMLNVDDELINNPYQPIQPYAYTTKKNKSKINKHFHYLEDVLRHFYPYIHTEGMTQSITHEYKINYDISRTCVAIDSKPIVGDTPIQGLYLNIAHGNHALALSFGCAAAITDKVLTDYIQGYHQEKPVIKQFDLKPFLFSRFKR